MAINAKGVFVGGLAAGLVIGISALLMVPVVGVQMEAVLKDLTARWCRLA
jgi:gas vesicle protein